MVAFDKESCNILYFKGKVILFNYCEEFAVLNTQFFKSFRFNLFKSKCNYSVQVDSCPLHFIRRIISGKARIVSRGIDLQLQQGDYFFIPKGQKYHVYWSSENGAITFSSFGFSLIPLATPPDLQLQKLDCGPEEIALFEELEQNMEINPTSIGTLYRLLGLILPQMAVSKRSKSDQILDAAFEFMHANHSYTMADVARHCGISESNLFIKFRKHLGKTPVEIRHQILGEEATKLLVTTDLTIEEISNLLGFSSSSYFRKIFKKATGETPTQIRNSQRQFF